MKIPPVVHQKKKRFSFFAYTSTFVQQTTSYLDALISLKLAGWHRLKKVISTHIFFNGHSMCVFLPHSVRIFCRLAGYRPQIGYRHWLVFTYVEVLYVKIIHRKTIYVNWFRSLCWLHHASTTACNSWCCCLEIVACTRYNIGIDYNYERILVN